ncbi:DUF637 domain-containing protein [Algicola sagamiensis]|uniref:DUF637 domain-containing protein n=1 Tax=Algicola sagamiensis TaxID=163869 RepID=UPI000367A7D3|nr:DUF637 domain-containing protein [Algicola sagamiensis]
MTLTDKYPSEKHYRPWHRVLSGLMAFLVFFQATIPGLVHASQLRDLDIQSQLHSNIRFAPAVVSDEQPYLYQNIDYFLDKKTNFFTQEAHNGQPLQYPTGIHWFYAKHHAVGPDDLTSDAYILLGNEYVQSRFIRMQIESLLNRQWITAKYQSETDQILALYRNGLSFASQHGLAFGEKRAGQAVTTDMILPELRRLQGQDVIVPVVYLTKETIQDNAVFKKHRVEFLGRLASWGSINIDGQTVLLGRNTMLKVAQDLRNHEGRIHSEGSLNINVGGTLANHSGRISAAENINIVSQQFDHKTVVHRFGRDYGYDERLGSIASVDSQGGNINIQTFGNTWIQGAEVNANNGVITIDAGGSINVSSVTQKYHSNQEHGDFKKEKTVIKHLKSRLSAKDTIRLIAKGGINITASELYADEGTIEIMADQGIYIGNAFDQTQHHNKYNEGGWKVEQTMFQTVAIRSALDAGKKVVINTALGHITLQAAKLRSGEGAEIRAEDGRVNFLMAKEQDHYFHHKIKKTFWKIKTDTKTDQVDTAVYNEIIGGVKVHATHGLTMEFGQKEGVTIDDMMSEFAETKSLSWMNDVYNDPRFSGQIDEVYQELVEIHKHDRTSSLSPAAMAIIAIAVCVAMGPAGAGWVGGATGGSIPAAFGISQAAMQAAAVTLATQAATHLASGRSLKGTLKAMTSKEGVKSVAIAMVTAGIMDKVKGMEFFKNANAGASTVAQAQQTIDIANQASQALVQSTVKAGISTLINGGDLDSFKGQFVQSLAQYGIDQLGESMAGAIKGAELGDALRYIAHAAAGCTLGVATAHAINNGNNSGQSCGSGALGGVVGEYVGELTKEEFDEKLKKTQDTLEKDFNFLNDPNVNMNDRAAYIAARQKELIALRDSGVDLAKLSAGLAAFIAGGDVHIAASTGENAAEHNAFGAAGAIVKGLSRFVVRGSSKAMLLLGLYDKVSTAKTMYDLGVALRDGDTETVNQILSDMAEEGLITLTLKQLVPGGKKLQEAVQKLREQGKHLWADDLLHYATEAPSGVLKGDLKPGKYSDTSHSGDVPVKVNTWVKGVDTEKVFSGTKGKRKELRKNFEKNGSNVTDKEAHHVIPWEFREHRLIKELNLDMNDLANGIMLPSNRKVANPSDVTETIHGTHAHYNEAIRDMLEGIAGSKNSIEAKGEMVIELIERAKIQLRSGHPPLMNKHGSQNKDAWIEVLSPVLDRGRK